MKILIAILLFTSSALACKSGEPVAQKDYVPSTAIPFHELMAQSMSIMDQGMGQVSKKASPDLMFLEMMKAHHEGALNMARAILVHGKNDEIKNLAYSIIASQQSEIDFMKVQIQTLKKVSK